MSNPVLTRLLAQRGEQVDFITHLLEQVETENRDLVDAERSNVEAARQRITQLDAQIEPLEAFESTRSAHEETRSNVTPTRPRGDRQGPTGLGVQPREVKYGSAGEFVVDFLKARGQEILGQVLTPDQDAIQRIAAATEGRALQTTTNTPGLLPEPIIGEILNDLDGSRPLVNSVGVKPLGVVPGKKFNRPYVSQHTNAGAQTAGAEGGALPSRQLVIDNLEFEKTTRGGSLEISRQDLDWTSPSAWNAILDDLQRTYGADSEDWTAGIFGGVAVTQSVEVAYADRNDVKAWIAALYAAAVKTITADGTKRASALRLPNKIWTSVDMWGSLGSMLSAAKTLLQSSGRSTPTGFDGDLLDIERVMAPGLPAGTMIIGRSNLFEFYEERVGLLQAVVPSSLKLEIAHGGYIAAGHLDATGFAKIVVGEETP